MPAPHTASTHPAAHVNPPPLRFAHRRMSLVLRTNDPTVRNFARTQFAPVIDASNRIYDHYAFVRSASDRIDVLFDGERLFEALIPQSADGKNIAIFYAVRDCFTHAISCGNDCVIYGASVAMPAGGVLILGAPGCGKTLTAVHLAALGGELLGDEVAVLSADGMLDAVPRALCLRGDTMARLPEAASCASQTLAPLIGNGDGAMYCIRASACGVREAAMPAPLRAIVVIEAEASDALEVIEPRTAAALFARYRQRSRRYANDGRIAQTLRHVPTFRANAGNPARIARHIDGALRCV